MRTKVHNNANNETPPDSNTRSLAINLTHTQGMVWLTTSISTMAMIRMALVRATPCGDLVSMSAERTERATTVMKSMRSMRTRAVKNITRMMTCNKQQHNFLQRGNVIARHF